MCGKKGHHHQRAPERVSRLQGVPCAASSPSSSACSRARPAAKGADKVPTKVLAMTDGECYTDCCRIEVVAACSRRYRILLPLASRWPSVHVRRHSPRLHGMACCCRNTYPQMSTASSHLVKAASEPSTYFPTSVLSLPASHLIASASLRRHPPPHLRDKCHRYGRRSETRGAPRKSRRLSPGEGRQRVRTRRLHLLAAAPTLKRPVHSYKQLSSTGLSLLLSVLKAALRIGTHKSVQLQDKGPCEKELLDRHNSIKQGRAPTHTCGTSWTVLARPFHRTSLPFLSLHSCALEPQAAASTPLPKQQRQWRLFQQEEALSNLEGLPHKW